MATMLKLMRCPRDTNRNRMLKRQRRQDLEEDVEATAEVERLFRRFWHEQAVLTSRRQEALAAAKGDE
tara:strand:- start:66 stop:269 length:204 start_codon:yes stop_codon:yes gene_type:complete